MEGPSLERELELFTECLELSPSARQDHLDHACMGNARFRDRVAGLLAAHRRAEGGTLRPLAPFMAGASSPDGDLEEAGDRSGEVVGSYRLLRSLAEGGMGSVWLAERTDGIIDRPIALKLPRGDWQRNGFAARLALEREILASLNHPNIARLYDAGFSSDGQPFLAMEYVEGFRIDEYCRNRELGLKARLALFLQVAKAVSYAHAKLIVHRDIKPANILVTDDGQVRLLDFGIAKMLEAGPARASGLTEAAGRVFTPDYASPEQIAGASITIASDVYSLGVNLYELLTRVRPYRLEGDSGEPLEDAILHADPARPSKVAAEPGIRRALRGDLDVILLKSLEKAPEDRYATVNAFVEDIERFLHDRPVVAQPDRAWYRLRKLVARNRLAASGAAVALVSVLAGSGVAIWQARVAQHEKGKSEAVREHLTSILRDASAYRSPARAVTVLDLLHRAKEQLDGSRGGGPELRVEMLSILGSSLLNQQDTAGAESALQEAVELGARELGLEHPLTIRARVHLLPVHRFRGQTTTLREKLGSLLPTLRADPRVFAEELAIALKNKAHLEIDEGRYEDAEATALEGRDVAFERLGRKHPEAVAAALMFALASQHSQEAEVGLKRSEEAYRLAEEVYSGNQMHPRILEAEFVYGRSLCDAGQVARGIGQIRRAVNGAREIFGSTSRMVGFFSQDLARCQLKMGEIDEALESSRNSLAIVEQHSEESSLRHASALQVRGEALLAARRSGEAAWHLERAADVLGRQLGPSHALARAARAKLALAWTYQGAAEKTRQELGDLLEEGRGPGAR